LAIAPPGQKGTVSLRRYDMRALWTLCGWGNAAALALLAVALTTLTDRGSDRLRLAASTRPAMPEHAIAAIEVPARPTPKSDPLPRQIMAKQDQTQVKPTAIKPEIPPELAAETERLASLVRELVADRDRLKNRLASLEDQLADVTGSIARQATAMAPPADKPAESTPAGSGSGVGEPPPVPVLTPPVGTPPLGSDVVFAPEIPPSISEGERQPETKPWPQPTPMSDGAEPETLRPESPAPSGAAPATEPQAGTSRPGEAGGDGQAGPDGEAAVLVGVPMPRMRVAAISSGADHAVDLGGAFSREALTTRWTEVKGKFGSQLHGLRPLIGLESRFGYAPYRLVVGPLADEAAAKKLCARLSAKINCRPTRFGGDRLARP
jgi:hypothetical protein